jgi:TM2 domain-containing membrane protein YozV
MTEQQRAWFYAEYQHARRDELIGILLAVFFGSFGVHHFYLGRNGLGILYLVFFWTGIPGMIGLIEAFFMLGRVRTYNMQQASYIANQILAKGTFQAASVPSTIPCTACGGPMEASAAFCPHCGQTSALGSVAG